MGTFQEFVNDELSISATIRQLVEERMETGRYTSEDEVLVSALQSLKEYDEAVADIQEGLDDEAAGRVRPLGEFDAPLLGNFDLLEERKP